MASNIDTNRQPCIQLGKIAVDDNNGEYSPIVNPISFTKIKNI